jgi:hypothetical protein
LDRYLNCASFFHGRDRLLAIRRPVHVLATEGDHFCFMLSAELPKMVRIIGFRVHYHIIDLTLKMTGFQPHAFHLVGTVSSPIVSSLLRAACQRRYWISIRNVKGVKLNQLQQA